MKLIKVLELNEAIIATQAYEKENKQKFSSSFSYGLVMNKQRAKPFVKSFTESNTPDPSFLAYDVERVALAKKYAKKNERQEPILVGKNFIIENEEVFAEELKFLQEKHKEAFENQKQKDSEVLELLETEEEFKPYLVEKKDLGENFPSYLLEGLLPIIKEEN